MDEGSVAPPACAPWPETGSKTAVGSHEPDAVLRRSAKMRDLSEQAAPLDITLLWIPATLAAAALQTARNAMQHHLTDALGTVGATQVRFLYGFPFALVFLVVVVALTAEPVPRPNSGFFAFVVAGALSQILATGLMLAAMRARSFAITIAYTKTEPVQVAIFGAIVLGDRMGVAAALAVAIATAGVLLLSWKPRAGEDRKLGPAAMGLASGAFFAMAAIGFRGAILALEEGSFLIRATTTLVWGLGIQTVLLLAWMVLFDRKALMGSLRIWRSSLTAGFLGSFASQFWFLGFALTAAANVRTLALVEVVFAAAVSRRIFDQSVSRQEIAGLVLIVAGVALLLAGTAG